MRVPRVVRTIVIVAATAIAVLVGRAIVEGRAAMRAATSLDAAGDTEGAIAHAMRAAKWYVPLASHPREAYDLLRAIARRAEVAGDAETALAAWQAIRASSRATRSLWLPYEDRLHEADRAIAVLLAAAPTPGIDRDKSREQKIAEHRALLARDDAPRLPAVVAMYAALGVFLAGALRLGSSLDVVERPLGLRRAVVAAAIAAFGLVAFAVAVLTA